VEDRQNFDTAFANAIRNDKWRIRHHQFARSGDAPWPSDFRLLAEQVNKIQDSSYHCCGRALIITGNVVADRFKLDGSR
jgi:hypothetical protein